MQGLTVKAALFKLRAFIALIFIFSFFAFTSDAFLSSTNLIILTKHVAINAILAIGMTFVILTAGIDLSVGSIVGLCGMIAGMLIDKGLIIQFLDVVIYFEVWVIVVISVLIGFLFGCINGFVITRLHVAPFIATLGMLYVARGFALLINNGATFPNLVGKQDLNNTGFPNIGAGTFLSLPYTIWVMFTLALIAVFLTTKTRFGRHIFAIGGNTKAANLSGVDVNTVTLLTYGISGLCAGIVGVIVTSQLISSHPATGTTWELNAIAAVVLGGTSLMGGRGSIGGTIIGAFVIGVLSNGMILQGVSSFWQKVIMGTIIVLAVMIDQLQNKFISKED
ncbi:MAG: Ribose import permease protein RbsC [Alphaproteobacteria bacterium MarineAlpha5_Bin10]|nr:MAG: Ribose import permease protein RbsC [Alphaproteobacteria bacterium MarineAlpha5_Bin10]|tara:strand:+ start:1661 stop:2668 length:1008 start_codon:yes stop_codon:yes gene_type:complete